MQNSGSKSLKLTKKKRSGQKSSSTGQTSSEKHKKKPPPISDRNWADEYIKELKQGKDVQFRPQGDSMRPLIRSGQLVTVTPRFLRISEGDVVLCTVNKNQYLHRVNRIIQHFEFEIGNMKGFINGTCHRLNIYGKVIKIED